MIRSPTSSNHPRCKLDTEQLKLGFHSIIVDDVQQVHHHISERKMAAC